MPKDDVLQTITSCIQAILPSVTDNQINAHVSLKDIGANSMDRVDIIISMMEDLDVDVDISEFAEAKNIGDILDIFENKLRALT